MAAPPAAPDAIAASGGLPAPAMMLDIDALGGLDDQAFVEQSYRTILGREADSSGLQYHVARLAAGGSRMELLGTLRYSREGRRVAVAIPGLRTRFLMHRLYRLPLLGRLIRIMTSLAALPVLMRDVIRLSADLRAVQNNMTLGDDTLRVQMRQADRRLQDQAARADHAEQALRRELERSNRTFELELKHGAAETGRMRTFHRALEQRLDGLDGLLDQEPWSGPVLELARRYERLAARLDEFDGAVAALSRQDQAAADLAGFVTALRQELSQQLSQAGGAAEGEAIARRLATQLVEQRNLTCRAMAVAEASQVGLRDQERRLSLILGEIRGWMAHGLEAGSAAAVQDHQDGLLDPLYVAFEDRFRGSRAEIKQRQAVYLDLLREAGAGQPGRPIVDVGSGRGELLELLGDEGLQARGVDLNRSMVAYCKGVGLDCTHDDAVAYLSRLEAGSLGGVTGFHIIEHLPFAVFVALLDASLRALAPGGVIVFETPNPANLLVSSRWFHLDPTHRNPLPAEMVSMIAEARGFIQVSIRELHPMAQRFEAKDDVLAAQLDAIFHGPQDYALIARKP